MMPKDVKDLKDLKDRRRAFNEQGIRYLVVGGSASFPQ
jgi:hypothetical protein